MEQKNFISGLATLVVDFIHKSSGMEKADIRNAMIDRGVFPNRIINTTQDGLPVQKLVPYQPNESFLVFAVEDSPIGLVSVENVPDGVVAQYNFQVPIVAYGAQAPYILNRMIMNMHNWEIIEHMNSVNISYSKRIPTVENMDTHINTAWWTARKITLEFNTGVRLNPITEAIQLEAFVIEIIRNLEDIGGEAVE